jgi:hypothetical protein
MAMASAAEVVSGDFNPERILSHRINPTTFIAEFRVKWEKYDDPKDQTWEPIDHIYAYVNLILEYREKKGAELAKTVRDNKMSAEAAATIPTFPVLDHAMVSKFKDPIEFIPNACEKIHYVISEMLSESGNLLWKVLFKSNLSSPRFIRKAIVTYYWPLEAALFVTGWVEKKKRMDERLKSLGQGKK